jgi:flagellar biogenesis protein FliO
MIMKQYNYLWLCLIVVITFTSCEMIGDIFQAGMAVGIFIIVAIVGLIIWLVSRFRR